jgi:hypothetical protein
LKGKLQGDKYLALDQQTSQKAREKNIPLLGNKNKRRNKTKQNVSMEAKTTRSSSVKMLSIASRYTPIDLYLQTLDSSILTKPTTSIPPNKQPKHKL